MLEYIIRRKWYLQKHLDAPLLNNTLLILM